MFTCSNKTNHFNPSIPVGSTPVRLHSFLRVNAYNHLTTVKLVFVVIHPEWVSKCKEASGLISSRCLVFSSNAPLAERAGKEGNSTKRINVN